MSNLTPKQQQMVMVGLVAAMLVVATYMLVISPQSAKMAENETVKTEYAEKKANADTMIANEEAFAADMESVKERLGAIEDQMAEGDIFLWFNLLLQKFKTKHKGKFDVEIPSVGREQRVRIGTIPEFPYEAAQFRVAGTGHFHDIGGYIMTFENEHPYIRVQNLTLDPGGADDVAEHPEILSFSMELVALIKPVEEEEEEEKK
jgi:Tfp pilus assembly protein PilO